MKVSAKPQQNTNEWQIARIVERYKCFDINMTSVGSNRVLVYSRRSGKSQILPPSATQLLLACDKFDTLQNHAAAYCRKKNWDKLIKMAAGKTGSIISKLFSPLIRFAIKEGVEIPLREKEVEAVKQQLWTNLQDGLLVSETDIRREIVEIAQRNDRSTSTSITITTVGIPTRNRAEILERAIASFMENSQRYGRQIDFVIVDDSEAHDVQQKNWDVLKKIKSQFGGDIYYAARRERVEYAKTLARESQVPLEVVEFALLGDNRCSLTTGASRNALLLHSVGELCLQTDDDTICKIVPSPEIKTGLALSSKGDSGNFWFYKNRNAAFDVVSPIDKDFLGIHEQLLGKSLGSCISANINNGDELYIDEMSPIFLKNMRSSDAKVVMTYVGAVGDSGLRPNSNTSRLFFIGGSYDRLIKSEQDYHVGLNTREVLRVAPRDSISDGAFFISMNIGLDNRSLLPPFMPVQRRSDGIFGRILRGCFYHTYTGFLPYFIYHDPPESRSEVPEEVFKSLESLRINDLLDPLILSFQSWPRDSDSARNTSTLGNFLMDLSSLTPIDLEDFVRTTYYGIIRTRVQVAEHRLEENKGAPEYWVNDMKRNISTSLEAVTKKDYLIPCDLAGSIDERWALFQELVHRFGELLVHWPAIIEAARDLRSEGHRLATKV